MIGWVTFIAGQSPNDAERAALGVVAATIGCQVLAVVLFPIPFIVWFPRARPRLLLYAVVQFACVMVFVYLASYSASRASDSWESWILALPFPAAALPAFFRLGNLDSLSAGVVVFGLAAAGTTAVVLATMWPLWLDEMRAIGRLMVVRSHSRDRELSP
jgi:hypothetical protein